MGEHCQHHHHHHHHHAASGRIAFAFFLNLSFAFIELVGGILVNSVAIISDAIHDFGDALALGFAWYMERKSHEKGDHKSSYGYRRWSVLSAFLTGGILLGGSSIVLWNTIPRLWAPEMPQIEGMIGLAVLGVLINGIAAFRLKDGHSLNEKMITWHMVEDLLGWVLVLVGAVIMWIYPEPRIDALMAIGLSCWVVWNVVKNLRVTLSVFLQETPHGVKLSEVEKVIKEIPQVRDFHHLHVWSLDGEKHILTAHLVVDHGLTASAVIELKQKAKAILEHQFQIFESTLEIEFLGEDCRDPEHRHP
ncbi:MAG: cation diffusion facilitator family transporter [Proteobacteria bacterium]|jgi:cobalt-zinc-cadmium efflux system protein|nr:cation diffusion facilitator family transporter [Pseudomonadota bacterium]